MKKDFFTTSFDFYEDECQDKTLVKNLNGCLTIFIRYCKEKDIYNRITHITTKNRLLGVLYDMRHWEYNYPCPLQHCEVFSTGRFDNKWLKYLDDFKEWARQNNCKDYKPILAKY